MNQRKNLALAVIACLALLLSSGCAVPSVTPNANLSTTPDEAVTPAEPATTTQLGQLAATKVVTNPIRMEFVLVSAGDFLMGSDPDVDAYATHDDQPQHVVSLPNFYISKYEITNEQYAAFVEDTGHRAPRHWLDGMVPTGTERHPVVWVTWDDAVQYAQWLSDRTGTEYRLPTEAEWEKACRGVDGRIYPWGNGLPDAERINFDGNEGTTTEVGMYSPQGDSPYGVADMAGNVWEWTGSAFAEYPYDPANGGESPQAAARRVMRGGAFYWGDADSVRCAERDSQWMVNPSFKDNDVGFRVAMRP